jgi:hypothetical protein
MGALSVAGHVGWKQLSCESVSGETQGLVQAT